MTRARIYSQSGVGGGNAAAASNVTLATLSPFLTTANVVELTNLYFTNARVFANLQLASIDDLRDVNTANSSNGQALIWNSYANVWAPGNVATSLTLDTLSPFLTTANVTESNSNLYYTNTRARTALTAADPTIIIDVVAGTIRANIAAVAGAANTTDGVPEGFTNQYFTNARVNAFIQPWLTTANVRELGNSLYFTNARVQTALSFANLVDIGDVVYSGTPSNNQVLTWNSTAGYWTNATANAGSGAATSNFAETANVANTVLTLLNFTTYDLNPDPNGINPYFSNTAVLALFSPGGNTQITTSNVAEGTNLYFTNARAQAAVTLAAVIPYLTTANVRETTNLYYTNARVVSAVLPYLTTSNVLEGSNLYYTNTRVYAFVQPYLTTANVLESDTALYYTNARVLAHLANSNVSTKFLSVTGNIYATENVTTSKNLVLSKNASSSSAASGSGIYIEGADASILYNDSTNSIDVNKNIIVTGNILPSISGIFNIGSASKKFRSIFLGTQTIFLGNVALGETPNGGLAVTTASGLPSDGSFANLAAIENITASRFTNAANSSTEANVYFGGNVAQFITNRTGNIYYGIKKNDNWNNFAGVRVQETRIVPLPVYPTYTWNVTNSFSTDYVLSGYSSGNDLPLTVTAGDTLVFEVNAVDHPLWIKTAQVTGTGSGVSTGNITNNGTDAGNVTWNTTGVAPGTYYYICQVHSNMGSTITVNADTQAAGNVRSDVIIYNDNELTNSSVARISVLGDGNTLFYGNVYQDSGSQLFANLVGNVTGRVSTLDNHTTANLREGTSLYYTNARVRSTLSSSTGVTYDSPNGVISIGQDVATTANVTFNRVTITDSLTIYGNVTTYNSNNISLSDNMIYLNNGSNTSNPDIGFAFNYNDGNYLHGGFFRDASDGKFKVFDNYTPEPDASIFIDTANASFRLANIQATTFFGNLSGTVDTLSNFTTANLTEGINLYYTNARVISALTPYLSTTSISEGSNLYYTNARVVSALTPYLTTANVLESNSNLYYTNSRVLSIVTPYLTTSNVVEGNNLYYTNSRVASNVIALLPSLAGLGIQILANGQINSTATATLDFALTSNIANTVLSISNFTTANLAEGSNLYYTNARVISAVTPYLTTSNVVEGTNLYFTNARVISAVTPYLTTSNVSEGSNLYYTNARVITEVTPYLTTANVTELNNLYYTNARVYSAIQSNLATKANVTDLTTANVLESNSNLYYTNSRVVSAVTPYLTTANVLELSSNLYYTNARVFANVAQMSINVFADVDMTGLQTSGILIWNGTSFVAGTVSAAASSNVALIAYQADHANTADVSNVANSVLSLTGLTTSNLLEGTNLYFTNARAAIGLTGLNVNVNDLYAAGNLTVQGEFTTLNVATLNIEDKNITLGKGLTSAAQADGAGISIDGAQANITYLVSGDKFNINKNVEIIGDISANTWTGIYSANVIESTNQYFTNTRAVLAITPYLTTANVTEVNNQYFTNARVVANLQLQSINVLADVDISGINNDELLLWNSSDRVFRPSSLTNKLTTANVVELTNLYFTNARVISTLSDGTANLTLYNLTTNGLLTVSSGSSEETTTGIEFKNNPAGGTGDNAKIQYYAANIGINDDTILEISVANNAGDSINLKTVGGGVGVNVARPIAEFDVAGNINARNSLLFSTLVTGPSAAFNNVTSNTWNGLYTANVIESASNLYFTNARALAAVQASLATNTSNVAEGSNLYYTNSRVISAITPYLTTANVTELTNQYFTNARVFANVSQMSVNVFADVDITGVQAGYSLVWNGSSFIASAPAGAVDNANTANTVLSISNFTTANLVEGNNLYYTNARVLSALTGNVTVGNLKVSTALNYSNTTGVTKVYQYYNEANLSLDTIFL